MLPARRLIVVPREAGGTRLDRFLAGALGVSRAELQRWIAAGRVRVEGAPSEADARVREGARIDVEPMPPAPTAALPEDGVAFAILHLDDDVIIVDKPAGLVVHPAPGHAGGTLVNGLLARGLFKLHGSDTDNARPGIVHRLDGGTTGVLVVARTPQAREALKAQFSAHTILREYDAIAVGAVAERTFDTLHGRNPRDRVRFTTRVRSGRRAVTHVRPLAALRGATHVACRLQTGRTHQIRVHLADAGTPVLGDPLYGKPPADPLLRAVAAGMGHQALHARILGFVHPRTGRPVRFEAPPPEDFQVALRTLSM